MLSRCKKKVQVKQTFVRETQPTKPAHGVKTRL